MEGLQDQALARLDEPSDSTLSSIASPRAVRFLEPSVAIIESSWSAIQENWLRTSRWSYETFRNDQVTDAMLERAAKLFNANYGTWGEHSQSPGKPVELSPRQLREQYLFDSSTAYYTVTVDGNLAGIAFITVDKAYRERGLASVLLPHLRLDADDIFGIMSSHPAACLAAASAFARTIEKVSLSFIKENAESIMQASPLPYIREAQLRGSLFDPRDSTGLVCGANAECFIDHEEPIEALKMVRKTWEWPLGDLLDGHKFLLILPGKKLRPRPHSPSNP